MSSPNLAADARPYGSLGDFERKHAAREAHSEIQAHVPLGVESDIDSFMTLIAPSCEWTIMATGEKFTGIKKGQGVG
jgi:hypothetical protein